MAKGDYKLFNNVHFQPVTAHARRYGVMFNPSSSRSRLRIRDSGKRYSVRLVDGKVEYNKPDHPKDVRGTIELLAEASHRATRCEAVQIEAIDDEVGDTTAVVTVKRILKKGEHALGVKFDGSVVEEDFRTFLSFLSQNLNATFVYQNGATPTP